MLLESDDNPTLGFPRPYGRQEPKCPPQLVDVLDFCICCHRISWRSIFGATPIASLASRLSRPAPGLSVEPLGFHCQPATLIIGKTHAEVTDLFPQHTIFLHQIFDDLLLPLIHPTGGRHDEKGKWIQTRLHSGRLPRARNALSSSKPRQSSFWMVRDKADDYG